MQRFHVMFGECLRLSLEGKQPQLRTALVQCQKATYQVCLDQGAWTNAWLLTGWADPLSRPRFAGEERELEVVSQYQRTLEELQKRVTAPGGDGAGGGGGAKDEARGQSERERADDLDGAPKGGRRAKGRGKTGDP